MAETIFYSWQADRDKTTGRNFVERSLERALGRLNEEVHLEEAQRELLALDKDTKGVAGQPPIVETIFKKIDTASAFVPDLTFVAAREDGRLSPNPNVLIEYGWALKSLGHSRIVAIMNTAYGEPSEHSMPFDMKHLRFPITYNLPANASDSEARRERESLSKALTEALASVLEIPKESISRKAKHFVPKDEASPGRFRQPGMALGISDHLTRLMENPTDIFLQDGGVVWLRVMPSFAQDRTWKSSVLKEAGWGGGFFLSPIMDSRGGMSELRSDDGFGVYSTLKDHLTANVSFAFETGEVWGIDSYVIPRIRSLASSDRRLGIPIFESSLIAAVKRYVSFLEGIGATKPYRWVAGIAGARGFGLYYPAPKGRSFMEPGPFGACVADVITAEGEVLEGDASSKSLASFFDKVFEKFGLQRPSYLDESEDDQ
jgi:hypothetical protein